MKAAYGGSQVASAAMYAVIDVETTGLSPREDRVIEVAVVSLDDVGSIQSEWCTLIDPQRDTGSTWAVRTHRIRTEDVSGSPTFDRYAGHLASLLGQRVIIGHNVQFDWGMLRAEFARAGHDVPERVPSLCTMRRARSEGLRPHRLDACCAAFGIPLSGAHHALVDARATAQLATRILGLGTPPATALARRLLAGGHPWPEIPVLESEPRGRPPD